MPGSCCAPNCKSNYDVKCPSVRVYRFPNDPQQRAAWTKAVSRENFTPTKHTVLCEKHFLPTDFVRTATYTDAQTGKVIEVPLERVRLKQTAVPSLFPNCPKHISRSTVPAREAPEDKKARLEAASLRKAIELSVAAQEEEDRRNKVVSFEEFCNALSNFSTSDFWTVIIKDSKVLFLDLTCRPAAAVRSSVTVSADLSVDVFIGEAHIDKVPGVDVPARLQDLRQLNEVLQCVQQLQNGGATDINQKARHLLETVLILLQDVCNEYQLQEFHGWHLEVLNFVISQLELILKNASRYSPDMLVFAGLLFTISPHAYKFIRSSMKVKLPHPDTIRRLCSSCQVSPALEQHDSYFLNYAKTVSNMMEEHQRTVTLMMDEIHLQPYFDYKGGFITGAAANASCPAKTAYVFMVQSLLSNHKDVVHILPVAQVDAKTLHEFLLKLVTDLELLGLKVIAVVSDNNSINRKAMKLFANPPKASIVYQHPADPSRPLFFVLDPVHVLKSVRNNWLNQRNIGKCIYFPDPKSPDPRPPILTASFKALRELHDAEQNELLKMAPTLSLKALDPSNMERQNVKLALRIFNESTVAALNSSAVQHAKGTADFIATILTWWQIVNIKTLRKGERLKDDMQRPVNSSTCPQMEFLKKIPQWLDYWASLKHDAGCLTPETHMALGHTSHALHEVSVYCLHELGFKYVLLGKFQTDCLEERFGKYRQLSGSQYHVSVRQIYESENKLRLQKVLDLPDLDVIAQPVLKTSAISVHEQFRVAVTNADIEKKSSRMPAVTYVAGYCAHVALKRLMCASCKDIMVLENTDLDHDENVLIAAMTRGGLKFPQAIVVNAVLFTEIVLDKLRNEQYASQFLALVNQKEALVALVSCALDNFEALDDCDAGHSPQEFMHHVLSAAANTLLSNLCKTANDKLTIPKTKRKLQTVQK